MFASQRRFGALLAGGLLLLGAVGGCREANTSPNTVISVSLDSIASPSVVVGDTMRDTCGFARPLIGYAYNINGDPIAGFKMKYRAIDPGIFVDSLTGFVIGDSVQTNGLRILADANGLQTTPIQVYVVPPPDSMMLADTGTDSLTYSLIDTASVSSNALGVELLSQGIPGDSLVQGYLVSFKIDSIRDSTSATPQWRPWTLQDTLIAQLVDATGRPSNVDTTNASGTTAGKHILVHPIALPSPTISVAIEASAIYKQNPMPYSTSNATTACQMGVNLIHGSPVRFILQVKPAQP